LTAGVLVPSFACRPNLWSFWPRALPPALAAADLPPVKAGKPTLRPEAPFIGGDPLLADLRQRLERHVLRPASTHDTVSPALLRSPLSGRPAGTS